MTAFRFFPEAIAELDNAATWYEDHQPGLGSALLDEFEARLAAAIEMPNAGESAGATEKGNVIRRYRLSRFRRYAILMATVDELPTVVAFEHSSRRPGYWKDRVK